MRSVSLGISVGGRHGGGERDHHAWCPAGWVGYLAAPDFWNRTFQNWQSEMLAVGSMAMLSVYLRQRGSPESKPVGAAHDDTGQTG
jgi:hypothetical protein